VVGGRIDRGRRDYRYAPNRVEAMDTRKIQPLVYRERIGRQKGLTNIARYFALSCLRAQLEHQLGRRLPE
jgi:hypothetical protein